MVLETIWRWNCSFNSKPPVLWWVKRNLPTEQTSCPGLQWVFKQFFSGNILYSATFSRQQSRSFSNEWTLSVTSSVRYLKESYAIDRSESPALALYTPTSVSTFSILFSISFLWYWQGEFIWRSKLLRLAIISFMLIILMNGLAVLL